VPNPDAAAEATVELRQKELAALANPHLARFRRICLALPEAHEKEAWGTPTFRVRDKLFAYYVNDHHGDGRVAAWCKARHVDQQELVDADPERFFVPPYVGPSGWVGMRLDRGLDWGIVSDLVEQAYRLRAPKRLATQRDSGRSARPGRTLAPAKARRSGASRFTPAPPELIDRFEAAVAGVAGVERRKMFGYPCAFVRGQMLAGVFQDRIMLRLSESDRSEFLALPGAKPFAPMPGRRMREYVEIPDRVAKSQAQLGRWMARGLEYVKELPAKTRPRTAAKPKAASARGPSRRRAPART
jgi:TfoX/Sxy family transcriptional regulator of competence genes